MTWWSSSWITRAAWRFRMRAAGSGWMSPGRSSGIVCSPRWTERFEVEVLAFGENVTATDIDGLEAEASRSEIAGALDGIPARFAGRAVAGIVVVSDGVATG